MSNLIATTTTTKAGNTSTSYYHNNRLARKSNNNGYHFAVVNEYGASSFHARLDLAQNSDNLKWSKNGEIEAVEFLANDDARILEAKAGEKLFKANRKAVMVEARNHVHTAHSNIVCGVDGNRMWVQTKNVVDGEFKGYGKSDTLDYDGNRQTFLVKLTKIVADQLAAITK